MEIGNYQSHFSLYLGTIRANASLPLRGVVLHAKLEQTFVKESRIGLTEVQEGTMIEESFLKGRMWSEWRLEDGPCRVPRDVMRVHDPEGRRSQNAEGIPMSRAVSAVVGGECVVADRARGLRQGGDWTLIEYVRDYCLEIGAKGA